jgi:hypothetical protein
VVDQVVSVMGTGFASDSRLWVGGVQGGVCHALNSSSALCPLPSVAFTSAYLNAQMWVSGQSSGTLANAVQFIPTVSQLRTSVDVLTSDRVILCFAQAMTTLTFGSRLSRFAVSV